MSKDNKDIKLVEDKITERLAMTRPPRPTTATEKPTDTSGSTEKPIVLDPNKPDEKK